MIVGFSHVMIGACWDGHHHTYTCKSNEAKWCLTRNRPTSHKLMIGFPTRVIPFELVHHNTGLVPGKPRVYIKGTELLYIRSRDLDIEKMFLSRIGIVEGDSVKVFGKFKGQSVTILLYESDTAPIDPPLDIGGCAAIAFLTSNIESDMSVLIEAGGRCSTGVFDMSVKNRNMRVAMLRSPEGTIVELIQVIG